MHDTTLGLDQETPEIGLDWVWIAFEDEEDGFAGLASLGTGSAWKHHLVDGGWLMERTPRPQGL